MTLPTRPTLYALAAATLATERGRGALGSVLITLGSELLPHCQPDPARDARIRDRVMDEIRNLGHRHDPSRNGHQHPPL
jgi:hypothetical protein